MTMIDARPVLVAGAPVLPGLTEPSAGDSAPGFAALLAAALPPDAPTASGDALSGLPLLRPPPVTMAVIAASDDFRPAIATPWAPGAAAIPPGSAIAGIPASANRDETMASLPLAGGSQASLAPPLPAVASNARKDGPDATPKPLPIATNRRLSPRRLWLPLRRHCRCHCSPGHCSPGHCCRRPRSGPCRAGRGHRRQARRCSLARHCPLARRRL
ncbi:MAG: hypothetical protein ACOYKQ_02245 [Polymorphobacter sp.]